VQGGYKILVYFGFSIWRFLASSTDWKINQGGEKCGARQLVEL